jgi:type IV secretory pathway TrbD component
MDNILPETHPIHASLVRPVLFAGAEPAAVIVEITTAFALVFGVGLHVATLLLALFYLTVVHSVMVWVAKQDPQMSALYLRSLGGLDFYVPHPSINAPILGTKSALPLTR